MTWYIFKIRSQISNSNIEWNLVHLQQAGSTKKNLFCKLSLCPFEFVSLALQLHRCTTEWLKGDLFWIPSFGKGYISWHWFVFLFLFEPKHSVHNIVFKIIEQTIDLKNYLSIDTKASTLIWSISLNFAIDQKRANNNSNNFGKNIENKLLSPVFLVIQSLARIRLLNVLQHS